MVLKTYLTYQKNEWNLNRKIEKIKKQIKTKEKRENEDDKKEPINILFIK